MSYPGEGARMSNNGMKERSPAENTGHWKEYVKGEMRLNKEHLARKGDGTKEWPGMKQWTKAEREQQRMNYFNSGRKHEETSTYDRMFHIQHGYDSRIHRDDRRGLLSVDVHSEESSRTIPVLSSSAYGRLVERMPLEKPSRQYARVEKLIKGFYRTRGTNLSPTE
ncbi:unnamed protein product [Owenia fusiformis]|uniref:Uncharacterized protein n=1 Tax=Owenia fusiformis TaxID=6347 RepID=A0A8S4Q907_OWEFU|nr:unnamed protein product [Owenia fusiformis]